MYIRFVINEIIEGYNQKLGVFHAIRYLRDDGELTEVEYDAAASIMIWFNENLDSPLEFLNKQRLSKSESCISWFKSSAKAHISAARNLANILENKNISTEMLVTDKPGKIIYQDEYQIFSKPFEVY